MAFFQKLKKSIAAEPETAKQKAKTTVKAKKTRRARKPGTKDLREKWFESEGKLTIDLYKAGGDLVIQSTIAGVKPEDLEITVQGDIVTIKGVRIKPNQDAAEKSYFYQECYWGPFSRQIVLPEEVDASRTEASLQEGILTVRIPRIEREKKRRIAIRG